MGYDKAADDKARYQGTVNDSAQGSPHSLGTSLQTAARPLTGMAEHTAAPNRLPAPPATAGSTMGSKPGPKNPASPGIRQTGVGPR